MNAIGVTTVTIKLAKIDYKLIYDLQALFYIDNEYESLEKFLGDIKVGNFEAIKVAMEGGLLRENVTLNPYLVHLKDIPQIKNKVIYAIGSNMPDYDQAMTKKKGNKKSGDSLSKVLESYYYIGLAGLNLSRDDLLKMSLRELHKIIDMKSNNGPDTKKKVPLEAII